MAEGKKSFIAYSDWKSTFDELPDDIAGKLIKHIFAYVNDEDPIADNFIINAVFANIKNTLKRDLDKWDNQLNQRREAGKRSAELRAAKSNDRSISLNETTRNPTVSDSVSVSVNVNNKLNDIDSRKLKFSATLKPFIDIYGKDFLNDFYKYWTEPNKSNTKFKQELEKTWSLERRLETWAKNDKNFNSKNNNNGKIINTPEFKQLADSIRDEG